MEGAVLGFDLWRAPSPEAVEDASLVGAASRGSTWAAEEIFRRYRDDVLKAADAVVRNRSDAEDVLQTTMIKALAALRDRPPRRLRPWLLAIARNEALMLLRARVSSDELVRDVPAQGALEQQVQLRLQLGSLVSDLKALPPKQRDALLLYQLHDLRYSEIADVLSIRSGAARQAVHQARRSLLARAAAREQDCGSIRAVLASPDGRRSRSLAVRAHLDSCSDCRRYRRIARAPRMLLPVPEQWLAALAHFARPTLSPLLENGGAVATGLTILGGALMLGAGGGSSGEHQSSRSAPLPRDGRPAHVAAVWSAGTGSGGTTATSAPGTGAGESAVDGSTFSAEGTFPGDPVTGAAGPAVSGPEAEPRVRDGNDTRKRHNVVTFGDPSSSNSRDRIEASAGGFVVWVDPTLKPTPSAGVSTIEGGSGADSQVLDLGL